MTACRSEFRQPMGVLLSPAHLRIAWASLEERRLDLPQAQGGRSLCPPNGAHGCPHILWWPPAVRLQDPLPTPGDRSTSPQSATREYPRTLWLRPVVPLSDSFSYSSAS